jgi:S-adenosylmethionine:diacylglycerol 3-amino-3-carboxypropyl transferase
MRGRFPSDALWALHDRDGVVRYLPLASDRDRIAAARYAIERLDAAMRRKRKQRFWHFTTSDGAIISERNKIGG